MYPTLEAICIVPMFPHSLNSRPISVPSNSEIQITIEHYNQPKPLLSYDGHTHLILNPGDMINITKHQRMVNLLHPLDYDYYKSLRTKLHWSKMLFD
jgi:NAD+ kinase